MTTYISILRGINVSGHKVIKMDALRNAYENIGFKDVSTYIQSGNVVFKTTKSSTTKLAQKISAKILELFLFLFEVPVLVLEVSYVEEVLKNNPFVNKRDEDTKFLHVTFLSAEPTANAVNGISGGNYGKDEYIIDGKTVFLFCPEGYGNTKLNNNFFENKLRLTATTRNWKTVGELFKIADEIT